VRIDGERVRVTADGESFETVMGQPLEIDARQADATALVNHDLR
jgi:hypothetical protein